MSLISPFISATEAGLVPDWCIRLGIRKLLSDRLAEQRALGCDQQQQLLEEFIQEASKCAIAELPEKSQRTTLRTARRIL